MYTPFEIPGLRPLTIAFLDAGQCPSCVRVILLRRFQQHKKVPLNHRKRRAQKGYGVQSVLAALGHLNFPLTSKLGCFNLDLACVRRSSKPEWFTVLLELNNPLVQTIPLLYILLFCMGESQIRLAAR
jgi:hypothetical protein